MTLLTLPRAPRSGDADTPQAEAFAGRELLRIVIVGHVDHGKSTLVGRLIYDTDSLPEGKKEVLAASASRRGMGFEWAFLMDAAQTERDQGITIDTAQIWLKTPHRDIVIIDAPGHEAFLKNMVTGAAQADAAVLVVDAEEGVADQTRRHAHLLSLLGLRKVIVAVNKMDRIGFDEARFRRVEADVTDLLKGLGVVPAAIVPISARNGTFVAGPGDADVPGWWTGGYLLEALTRQEPAVPPRDQPLRLSIQDVYKFDDRRIFAGRIDAGTLGVGDELIFLPGGETARVARLERWPTDWPEGVRAGPGQSVGITLDKPIFAQRGEVAAPVASAPVAADRIHASLFWLGTAPLVRGDTVQLQAGSTEVRAVVERIDRVVDAASLAGDTPDVITRGRAAEVVLVLSRAIATEPFAQGGALGRFVLSRDGVISGGGLVRQAELAARKLAPSRDALSGADRQARRHHTGGMLWLTGLSGAGKSTLAIALEKRLFDLGWTVVRLDGDDLRLGLNKDLGFTDADRDENLRRAAEVGALLVRSGVLVIGAFVSPLERQRQAARQILGSGFREVYVATPLEVCEARDVKGLYARARTGEVADFPGISATFEAPANPDLRLVPGAESSDVDQIAAATDQLLAFVRREFAAPDPDVWP